MKYIQWEKTINPAILFILRKTNSHFVQYLLPVSHFVGFFFLFCSKIFSIKKTKQIIFIFREKPTPRLITTRMEMTEGMRVWTSPRPEGNVKKTRVTSAWMNCTSRLRGPGKGGRLKMWTASKRYRRSIRFFLQQTFLLDCHQRIFLFQTAF